MSQIMIMFDTETKQLALTKDGEVMKQPKYASFDWCGEMSDSGERVYEMRIVNHKKMNGMMIETTVRAESQYCKDNPQKEKCKKTRAGMENYNKPLKDIESVKEYLEEMFPDE